MEDATNINTTDKSLQNDNYIADNKILINRYVFVMIVLCLLAVTILFFAFRTGVSNRKSWMAVAASTNHSKKIINPVRGIIYSDDDRIMAANSPHYYLYLDFGSEGFLRKGDIFRHKTLIKNNFAIDSLLNSKYNNIDSLSKYLSRQFKDRTPAGYKAHILNGLKSKNRNFLITSIKASHADYKTIKNYPFLRIKGNSSFFFSRSMMHRDKPFGILASRTIGDIYGEIQNNGLTKARSGLEQQYDSLLRGEPGLSSFKRSGASWIPIHEIEPNDGLDIRSTINIEIQDIVEKALEDKLKETDADAGTAVVMEVKTGDIKAITNLTRKSQGLYTESTNHAIADLIEPGSTFKVAAMMVALEDGVTLPSTPVDVGNGKYVYANKTINDHNLAQGGYGLITAEKSIWYSSNIGIAKIILKGYDKNPKKFVDGLHNIGMDYDLKIGLPEANKSRLRHPGDKLWSKTSLPWMSFGYEVQIPPIQTLTFYNAIANNGTMIKPRFVTDILSNGVSIKHFNTDIAIKQICSDKTLSYIKDMLYNVVNYTDPSSAHRNGTGRAAKSEIVTIAGKTGTAQVAHNGTYRTGEHNISFCGYFPYEAPQYSCIVVIHHPRRGVISGGQQCGSVVKEIAEKIYSENVCKNIEQVPNDTLSNKIPQITIANDKKLNTIFREIGINKKNYENRHSLLFVSNSEVPDLTGMGAKDAIFALEQLGMTPLLTGNGKVVNQSLNHGYKTTHGQKVTITLK